MSVFPAAVSSDSDLLVAADLASTILTAPINNSTLSIPVAAGTRFRGWTVITIESEQILISGTGSLSLTVAPGGRGYGGTTAASHVSGVDVRANVVAAYHNALAGEIKAVQTRLGANLANIALADSITPASVNFTPQSPGGSLTVGSNTITMTPVPLGVNGSDIGHYLYITGGTGTAEAVKILGGTAVAGSGSGTLIIQCANTHSGAWTIRSATAGIQEALQSMSSAGGTVIVPRGTYTLNGPIFISGDFLSLVGMGSSATILTCSWPGGPAVTFDGTGVGDGVGTQNSLRHLQLSGVGNTQIGLSLISQSMPKIENVVFGGFSTSLKISSTYTAVTTRCIMTGFSGNGLYIVGGGGGFFSKCVFDGRTNAAGGSAGVRIESTGGTYIQHCDAIYCGYGLVCQPANNQPMAGAVWITDCTLDTSTYAGALLKTFGSGASITNVTFTGGWAASSAAGSGVVIDGSSGGKIQDILFSNYQILGNGLAGLQIRDAKSISYHGGLINSNSQSSDGTYAGVQIDGASTWITINGTCFMGPLSGSGPKHQTAVYLAGAGVDYISVRGIRAEWISDATADILLVGVTGQNLSFDGNIGSATALYSKTVSSGTLDLGTTPGRMYNVTSGANLATISPAWKGREVVLINTTGGSLSYLNSGNIRIAGSIVSGASVRATYDGTKWNLG
jgi:hypothetical protein